MKKIVIALGLAAVVGTSYGQGYVSVTGTFQNYTNATALTTAWTGGSAANGNGTLGATTTGQQYYVALLTSTEATPTAGLYGDSTLSTDWLYTGLIGGNNTFAGRLTIGAGLQAANAAVGNTQNWVLVAWSASLGSAWSTVSQELAAGSFGSSAGYIGWSSIVSGAAGAASPSQPLVISGTPSPLLSTGFSLMSVAATPEPTTMALAGLGIAGLVALRRKK